MANFDKEKQEYFRRKLRIALLGEPSYMTQMQVTELCKKFFEYAGERAYKTGEPSPHVLFIYNALFSVII